MATEIKIDEKTGKGTITFEIPGELTQSRSGKSILLVTSGGTVKTGTMYKGHPVSLNLNVTIPNPTAAVAADVTAPTTVTTKK